jgi:hypothetical protein
VRYSQNFCNKYETDKLQKTIVQLKSAIQNINDIDKLTYYLENVSKNIKDLTDMFIFMMNEADLLYKNTEDNRAMIFLNKLKEYDNNKDELMKNITDIITGYKEGKSEDSNKIKEYLESLIENLNYELTLFNGFINVRNGILKNEIMIKK